MEIQHETAAENTATPVISGSALLIAQSQVKAARARTAVPSDTTAGKSDGNDG
ncbi:hypothetical protein [Streptomyces nitrosporeus]|uniref:hypothetical protein n=1 Tax=Streptomyces nitrosporeus TaxID=28894 RepID=UPI003329B844